MDKVFIKDLRIATIIGIHDREREVKQTLVFDLEMEADISKAAQSDNVRDALNYQAIAERMTDLVENSNYQLLEALAERAAAMLLKEFAVHRVLLRVSKPGAIPDARNVGVIIERGSGKLQH